MIAFAVAAALLACARARPAEMRFRGGVTAQDVRGGAASQSDMLERLRSGEGFVAALDQSGGSTPGALKAYGVPESAYTDEGEMFDLVHQMRERIACCLDERCIGAILFEDTMDRTFGGRPAPAYLWSKRIVPLLKCDKGLAEEFNGCQLMREIPNLEKTLARAKLLGIAGTKMRSRIMKANEEGIKRVVKQQFEIAKRICKCGLVPIVEPEVDAFIADKGHAEEILLNALHAELHTLAPGELIMLKLTLPEIEDLYASCVAHPNVVRVLALSGGFDRNEACARLKRQSGVIASFSRALTEGLSRDMDDATFSSALDASCAALYDASFRKITEDDGAAPAMYRDVSGYLGKD
jgi:fructose-bisphosphate aldolase class I